jgi:DNA mismatch endonuclease (patch repair protein)
MPATNEHYWHKKISRNISRDRAAVRSLKAAGWRVIRFWGHALRDPASVSKRIIKELSARRSPCKHMPMIYEYPV